jgi:predicted RNA-binding Zn-ribbon protein involved in translation (DUF1610 family)
MHNCKSEKWIKAGIVLGNDLNAKVKCPECEQVYLRVEDVRNDSNPNELERILLCLSCGSYNILRLKRPYPGGTVLE